MVYTTIEPVNFVTNLSNIQLSAEKVSTVCELPSALRGRVSFSSVHE